MALITDFFGKASIDTDHSVATTVKNNRTAGVFVLECFDLSTFTEDTPVYFVTYTKTTDPVTSEVTITDTVSWKGLVNAGANTITNLEAAPGYVDGGNTEGQFVECIPTSYWANDLVDGIQEEHKPTGKHSDITADSVTSDNIGNSNGLLMPVGSLIDYAGTTAPTGWLLCYGQTLNSVSNTEYAALYTAIGNTYGGTDGSDFVVPDLRGRVVAGQDDMGGTSANRLTGTSGGVNGDNLGDAGGSQTHTLTASQMPSHNHNIVFPTTQYVGDVGSGGNVGSTAGSSWQSNRSFPGATNGAGSNAAHNNVQPTIILNKIIKY